MSSSSSQAEKLRQAAAQGDADQVKALLEAGARIEPDLEGRTALHLASANGHLNTVKALINGGAKINTLDAAGYSPLHQAATEGHEEVVKLLLKSGCHVDTQDELHGNTALHEAAWKGFSRTLETLCKHRANVYIKNNGGFTALHLSCQNGHNQCCRILLLSACKPDVRNSQYGDTPLHTAARYGHAGVLRILISAFANVSETNKNGDTALHISAAMGRNKLTRILLEAECDQKVKNNQGETARDIAERKEFTDVVRLLDNPPVTRIPVQDHSSKKQHSKKREKDSNTSQESTHKEKKDKHKKSKKHHKVHFYEVEKKGNVSPYGCHMYPDMNYFPSIKLKSLPKEPLKDGEQYYADLAGNIKKGPRGLGYMCYCAPFFNHVEKKLDANKKELLDHIDSRNEDLKQKISHLEKRTHDQLFSLNQKMKESLAIERGECAERIDRRLFRERRELEQHQEKTAKALQSEVKSWLHHDQNGRVPNGQYNDHYHVGNQPLTRSKSEDLLSETNSNHNSISLLSSTVTGVSRFTNNSAYNRTYLNPAQCGTKPKAQLPNISRLRMRCMGYPELKRESRSEGDLTSCYTDVTDNNTHTKQRIGNVNTDFNSNVTRNLPTEYTSPRSYRWSKEESTYPLWKNEQIPLSKSHQEQRDNKNPGFHSDAFKSQNSYHSARPSYCAKYNRDPNQKIESPLTDIKAIPVRTQSNGFPGVQGHAGKLLSSDRDNGLPHLLEHDGSSFV